ncbi:MAG: hypothetical protein R3B13_06130 [Polyangiaceae bacterium]
MGTLKPPVDGKYAGTLNVQYPDHDPNDVVSFAGNVTLKDCDAK